MNGIPVELKREHDKPSHSCSFLTSDASTSGVSCVKRNRARLSRAALTFATNSTLQEQASSVYTEGR
jgi:hypothetical protein